MDNLKLFRNILNEKKRNGTEQNETEQNRYFVQKERNEFKRNGTNSNGTERN